MGYMKIKDICNVLDFIIILSSFNADKSTISLKKKKIMKVVYIYKNAILKNKIGESKVLIGGLHLEDSLILIQIHKKMCKDYVLIS